MPFNIQAAPWKLTGKDFGSFDLGDSIRKGFGDFQAFHEAKNTPARLSEELLGKHLSNALNKVKAQYAPQQAEAELAHQNALTEKAKRGPQPLLSNLEKALAGTQRIKQQYGADSPEAKAAESYVQRLAQGSQGITVSTDPETGQPLVQIGGNGGRSQGGKIVQNPVTGEAYAQPTGAVATSLQNKIIGEEQIEPIMKDIIENVPQFQSGWTNLKRKIEGGANEWLGADYRLPSAAAKGKSSLSKSAESLVKLYGLNATSHNVDEVKNILTPGKGESKEGYKARIMEEMKNFANSKKTTKSQLSKGINVYEGNKSQVKLNDPLGIR